MRLISPTCSIALLLMAKGIQAESIVTTTESRAAYDCQLKASVKCIINDERAELEFFKGMDCDVFSNEYRIKKGDEELYKDGKVNPQGLPFVKTSWIYNLCNGGNEDVQFLHWLDTHGVFFANKKTPIYDENFYEFGRGVLKAGYCQSAIYDSDLNSFKRKHRTDVILKARLNRNRQLKCDARASKKIRFRYSDDCKVEANTECTLRGTDIPCNENIEYRRYGKCSEIPVTYKYEVCNEESIFVTPDKKKSKAKLDKVNKGKVNGPIAAGQCWSKFVYDTINDCDRTPIRMQMKFDRLNDPDCFAKSVSFVQVENQTPSAAPSSKPTLSRHPSAAPTISHAPTLSQHPSVSPSASPSKRPTAIPSKSPSSKPTSLPSSNPTKSQNPSQSPSKSSTPSSSPSISQKPSPSPTKLPSSIPSNSLIPSAEPTTSHAPSNSMAPSPGPTTCVDDPSYSFTNVNGFSGDCDSFVTVDLCDKFDKPQFYVNGKGPKEACCICEGGKHVEAPSEKPSSCEDLSGWTTNLGVGCDQASGFCNTGSTVTDEIYGATFDEACCACGGGKHVFFAPSPIPSSMPSFEPTVCVDDPNWTSVGGIFELTCQDIGDSNDFACTNNDFANTAFNGKTVRDACCKCGGTINSSVSPTSIPSTTPSASPSTCESVPGWELPGGDCESFVTQPNLCDTSSAVDEKYKYTAEVACCACGGGKSFAFSPSQVPSSMPSQSTAPSKTPTQTPVV